MELKCKVQNYDWGKLGSDSIVARLMKSADPTATIDEKTPYAELWLGTHPNGPSLIIDRDVLLSEYIKDNLDAIGPEVRKRFGVEVPFLLKVLSVRKALSIQVHPSKDHAEELHAKFPDVYKDPNHKPELAIALTQFEALCGFRSHEQIRGFIQDIPELLSLLSSESVDKYMKCSVDESEHALMEVFESLMNSDEQLTAGNLNKFIQRLHTEDSSIKNRYMYEWLTRLNDQFPGDIGCWMVYFLNHLILSPGEAIYLGPNVPHAYLSGDCVECMSRSDNVLRAGLTVKPRDPGSLAAALRRGTGSPAAALQPQLEDACTCVWRPPVEDFAVAKIKVPSGWSHNTLLRASPSLLLVVAGEGTALDTEPIQLRPGTAMFLKASRQLTLTPRDGHTLELYQAMCNL